MPEHKKCSQQSYLASHLAFLKMYDIANVGICFGIAKGNGESFRLEAYLCIFAKIICIYDN